MTTKSDSKKKTTTKTVATKAADLIAKKVTKKAATKQTVKPAAKSKTTKSTTKSTTKAKATKAKAKSKAKGDGLDWSVSKEARFADYGNGVVHFQVPNDLRYVAFNIADAPDALQVEVAKRETSLNSLAGTPRKYAACKLMKSPTDADAILFQTDGDPIVLKDFYYGFSRLTPTEILGE